MFVPLDPPKPSRTGKQRDTVPREPPREIQPTDVDKRLIALQRMSASFDHVNVSSSRNQHPREQRERITAPTTRSSSSPKLAPAPASASAAAASSSKQQSPRRNPAPSAPTNCRPTEADPDDFSRRLKISSPRPRGAAPTRTSPQLYNPDRDPIPMRLTTEPEPVSDSASSSYVPRGPPHPPSRPTARDGSGRQLFDHRKDDPVRFAVLARPQGKVPAPPPQSRGSLDHFSASSVSSYANSLASSNFTLSSTTDGSSTSSALFDQHGRPREESSSNMFGLQLKKLYRTISSLESKIKDEDADEQEDAGRVVLKGKQPEDRTQEIDKWQKQLNDHKALIDTIHNLLEISLAPSVPVSLRNIPKKYNIIARLWTNGFHKILESLRRASLASPVAMEYLQDFIYYSYTFYTGLVEEQTLKSFKNEWLEALGDLARYRMAIAAMVHGHTERGPALTVAAVSVAAELTSKDESSASAVGGAKSVSDAPVAHVGDSPSPSIGPAAARLLVVEPEKERWRYIARDWYSIGLTDQPGNGRLHHHLGLLCRETEGEELRGIYHFIKSMTTLHPFSTSRESVLHIWSPAAQARRSQPDSHAVDLFVLLHGMLFTNIQLDDFRPTLSRFIERLEFEGAEDRGWIMMAIVNIGAMLEYGKHNGILRRAGVVRARDPAAVAAAAVRVMAKRAEATNDDMDVDEDQHATPAPAHSIPGAALQSETELPVAFKLALQLSFAMLSFVLRHPTRKASQYAHSTLNPYLTIMMTFLATVLQQSEVLKVMERSIPWEDLASFFATIPAKVMVEQGMHEPRTSQDEERWALVTSGCQPPLPEDWCIRGMEWVGRKVYERGFWKSGEDRRPELEVLNQSEESEEVDGQIEDDDDSGQGGASRGHNSELRARWTRTARCAVDLSKCVSGFTWVEGTHDWRVEGALARKVEIWREEDRIAREEEERRRTRIPWDDDSMDVDEDDAVDGVESDDDDDAFDTLEVKALKARRRELQALLNSARCAPAPRSRSSKTKKSVPLAIVPGYTILVVDTNIFLSSLSMLAPLIESHRWTVVVPLPVVMELEGLSSNKSTELATAAQASLSYLSANLRQHSISLKVQTSKGNYLTSLGIRTEEIDFSKKSAEHSMDDLILKAAVWQDEHWVDRSDLLQGGSMADSKSVKVVLLSLDRNLRDFLIYVF
ncbi:hypothetical protein FISHEDRAFT_57210 [Fistulina hepatica ATCC 64428]|nr:hypothetical protein FISHEDRAFT_57210 [Fistulina hepatica ATCC 64428]